MYTAVFLKGGVEQFSASGDVELEDLKTESETEAFTEDYELVCIFEGDEAEPLRVLLMTYDRSGTLSPNYEPQTWVEAPKPKRKGGR